MLRTLAIVAVTAALATSTAVVDDPPAGPPGGALAVDVVTVTGSGCPAGGAAVAADPDTTSFTITFDRYVAEIGPTSPPAAMRRTCRLVLAGHPPQGQTWGVVAASYRGRARFAPGVAARYGASYQVADEELVSRTHLVDGRPNGAVQVTDVFTEPEIVWAPCGVQSSVIIGTEVRMLPSVSDPRTVRSFATIDQAYGLTFALRSCEAPDPA